MAVNANFATTPRYEIEVCSTVNTNYDGTGTIVTLFDAGPNGSRIDGFGWAAQGNSTSGRLNVFARGSSEETWRFVFSFEIPAITVSATQPPASGGFPNVSWVLKEGAQIGFAATVAGTYMMHAALAGDF
jgi:hypothetical protein